MAERKLALGSEDSDLVLAPPIHSSVTFSRPLNCSEPLFPGLHTGLPSPCGGTVESEVNPGTRQGLYGGREKAGSLRLRDLPKVTPPVAVGLQPEPSRPRGPAHLHQLHEVLKVDLFIDAELAGVVHDAVVLHLAVTAHAQRVVPGVVGALPHQEQTRLWWAQEPLCLLPRDLAMEPAAGRPGLGSWQPKGSAGLHFPKALPLAGASPGFVARTGAEALVLIPSEVHTHALLVSRGPHGHPSSYSCLPAFLTLFQGTQGSRPPPSQTGAPDRSLEVLTA